MSTSEKSVLENLRYAAAAIAEAQRHVDDSTEYLEDDLSELAARLGELLDKLGRDDALQRDRAAFAEPATGGLKEWLGG